MVSDDGRDWRFHFPAGWVVVGCEPDWNKGEVSRDSPVGFALLGAHAGEERKFSLPEQDPSRIRIVLIADA